MIMTLGMKLCEDDLTQDTGQPEREPAEEPGKYYYDDSTGYELYEPTPSSEEDGGEGQGATVNPAHCYGARNIYHNTWFS